MRRLKIGMLAGVICVLFLLLAGKAYLMGRQEVLLKDFTFEVTAKGQTVELKLWHNYYNGKEYLFLPSFCDEEKTVRIRLKNRLHCEWNGEKAYSWSVLDSVRPGEYSLVGGGEQFLVEIMQSENVPALFLTTKSGGLEYIEAQKGNGEPGLLKLIDMDGSLRAECGMNKLRSRGNVSFLEDKKPYQINLEEEQDLIGAGSASKYILLANRADQTLLRNQVIFDLARNSGMQYVPQMQFVDLYVNSEYRGSYQLSEKVETGESRIALRSEDGRTDTGYLLELEYLQRAEDSANYFISENNQLVLIRSPKNLSESQRQYIEDYFGDVEDDIRQGRFAMIDMESFARKYVIEEVSKNLDSMYSSQYFYKEGYGGGVTLYAGPVWDFDKALGNPFVEKTRPVNFQDPRGIYAGTAQENGLWWFNLYSSPAFYEQAVKEYKEEVQPEIQVMLDTGIDRYTEEILPSVYMDYMRWDTFEDFKNEEPLEFEEEYRTEIGNLKNFIQERMEFLNDIWLEGKTYNRVTCDPVGGTMYVTYIEAVEGRTLTMPADPKMEGYKFKQWIRQDTGEVYDFTQVYEGIPFTLTAEYEKKE